MRVLQQLRYGVRRLHESVVVELEVLYFRAAVNSDLAKGVPDIESWEDPSLTSEELLARYTWIMEAAVGGWR
jgi:hypothetical protein